MKEHNDNLLKFFALKLLAPMIWAMFVPIHFMFLGEIFQKQSPKPRPATLLKTRFWHRCFRPATMLKKRLWHRCFPVNFAKFLKTRLLIEHLRWLLLAFQSDSTLYSFTTSCSKQAQYLKFKWTVTSRKYSRSNIPQTICLCYMAGF